MYNRPTIDANNWRIQRRRIWKCKLDDIVTRSLQQLGRSTVILQHLLLRLILLLLPCQCLLLCFFLYKCDNILQFQNKWPSVLSYKPYVTHRWI